MNTGTFTRPKKNDKKDPEVLEDANSKYPIFVNYLKFKFAEVSNISHGMLKLSWGNIRENSGNFVFIKCWEPCSNI